MARVPFDPLETNLMPIAEIEEFFPEIPIFSKLLVLTIPSVSSPTARPTLLDSVHQIFRIAEELYFAGLLQRSQALDGCGNFHPIIRGEPIPSRELFAVIAVQQNDAVTARTGIPDTSTISVYSDALQGSHRLC